MNRLGYVASLARFAFGANRGLYASVVLSLVSAGVELLAMVSLLPLLSLLSGGPAIGPAARLLSELSVPPTSQALLWVVLGLLLARIVTLMLAQTTSVYFGRKVMAQIGSTAFARVVGHVPLVEINARSMGHFIGLAGEEAFRASVVVIALAQCAGTLALAALYFAAIAYYTPAGAAITAAFLAVAGLFGIRVARGVSRLGARQVAESRAAASVFLDALNNLKTVRAFTAESYVTGLYSRLVFGYARTWFWIDEYAVLTRLVPIVLLLFVAGVWLLLTAGSLGTQGLPFLVTLIAFFLRLFPTLGQAVSLAMRVATESRSGHDLHALLDRPATADGEQTLGRIERIDIDDLHFRHAAPPTAATTDAPTPPVLDGVSLHLQRGRSYALVGRSGSGKSTLVDLLLRFYEPAAGTITIDGKPLHTLPATEVRRHVVLVGQEPAIFNDTVANNVRLGWEADDAALHAACHAACADEFIAKLAHGYDTMILYHGKNLSGGQRQRLAIARALLRQPDVLILDESTNALDKRTQDRLIGNLLTAYADRILVLVTHDPELAARVDTVIELGNPVQAATP